MISFKHIATKSTFIFILFAFSWCVEPYKFKIINTDPALVIEAFISDKSFNETLNYPSDGRYFEVKLKWTSDVENIHDEMESMAIVLLRNNLDDTWMYQEVSPGIYQLKNNDFKASVEQSYKLEITLANGDKYESTWEKIPEQQIQEMSVARFEESTKNVYEYQAGEKTIVEKNGINLILDLPKNITSDPIYYRWSLTPTWIHVATFTNQSDYGHKCWINNSNYLNNFTLNKDLQGNTPQKLAFIETTGNDKIYHKLSILVRQLALTPAYYQFWDELQQQTQKGGLFDAPPYNLLTNYKATNSTKKVYGYFGVAREQATRWYFTKDQLSYNVYDNSRELCSISYGPGRPGGPECYDCLSYPYGDANNIKPWWWQD